MGEKAWPGWAGGWNAYESLQRTKLDFPACIPLRLSGTLPSNGPGMGEKWGEVLAEPAGLVECLASSRSRGTETERILLPLKAGLGVFN